MSVCLGHEREKITGGLVSRRFDGDDTLQDVLLTFSMTGAVSYP